MACRGVFFAITPVEANALLALAGDDDEVMERIEEIEEAWDEDNLTECDKSWDAMHRCLTDGELEYGNDEYPLSHCVLGPRQLHEGDDYIVSLVLPDEVRDVARALDGVTREWFDDRYSNVLPRDYAPEYGPIDRDYTWDNLEDVRTFYRKAAELGRAVLFTVDQ